MDPKRKPKGNQTKRTIRFGQPSLRFDPFSFGFFKPSKPLVTYKEVDSL